MDDLQLARAARADAEAFDALYRRYVTPVFRFCYARVNGVADAEDLTAQTFLAALESLARFNGRGSFAAWLFSIARYKCADFYRAHYANRTVPLGDVTEPPDLATVDSEAAVYGDAVLACVGRVLPTLSPDRAEALHLRFWGGLSMQEIAKVMKRNEAAVKMLVSRAITDLRGRCLHE